MVRYIRLLWRALVNAGKFFNFIVKNMQILQASENQILFILKIIFVHGFKSIYTNPKQFHLFFFLKIYTWINQFPKPNKTPAVHKTCRRLFISRVSTCIPINFFFAHSIAFSIKSFTNAFASVFSATLRSFM